MKKKWRVLVIGEDEMWSEEVAAALEEEGSGLSATTGTAWTDVIAGPGQAQPNALILLVEEPRVELFDTCRTISASTSISLILLCQGGDESFASDALEAGADDFVSWPISAELLSARVRAVLRREDRSAARHEPIEIRDLTVDLLSHEVTMKGRRVELTPTEFRILACLVRNAGQVIPSRVLLKEAQGYDCEEQEAQDIVKVHIRRLRNKIEPNAAAPIYIINVRGFGYMLERRNIERQPVAVKFA